MPWPDDSAESGGSDGEDGGLATSGQRNAGDCGHAACGATQRAFGACIIAELSLARELYGGARGGAEQFKRFVLGSAIGVLERATHNLASDQDVDRLFQV